MNKPTLDDIDTALKAFKEAKVEAPSHVWTTDKVGREMLGDRYQGPGTYRVTDTNYIIIVSNYDEQEYDVR